MRTAREKSGFKAGLRQRKNRALSVDRKLLGTSTIGPHPAQPVLRLLLMIGPARPTLAEVPLADLCLGRCRDGDSHPVIPANEGVEAHRIVTKKSQNSVVFPLVGASKQQSSLR